MRTFITLVLLTLLAIPFHAKAEETHAKTEEKLTHLLPDEKTAESLTPAGEGPVIVFGYQMFCIDGILQVPDRQGFQPLLVRRGVKITCPHEDVPPGMVTIGNAFQGI